MDNSKVIYVADYSIEDYPAGAEMVDYNIYKALNICLIKSPRITSISKDFTYIISNATMLRDDVKKELIKNKNYIIMEHDYKIHPTRQPHRYQNGIFPQGELINVEFFMNAQAVLLQSFDQLDCYNSNNIKAKFVVLDGSIWSDVELKELSILGYQNNYTTHKFAIIDDKGPDKGTENAIAWCKANVIDYNLIPKMEKLSFYRVLSKHPALVYIPNVRESFCRLVVEARCLNMNVLTPKAYGASKSPWFSKCGDDMIFFLKERTKENLNTIKELC